MRLIPASRHMSTCRRASSTSVLPTLAKLPRPPNVMVPIVSTETRRPDLPSLRYSMGRTLPSSVRTPWSRAGLASAGDGTGAGGVAAGQLPVDLRVVVDPLLGPAGDPPGHLGRDAHGQHAVG